MAFFAGLDTRFLLALQYGDPVSEEAIDCLSKVGGHCIVTDTVLQEIQDLTALPGEVGLIAKNTLISLKGNFPVRLPGLIPVQNGIAEIVADRLLEKALKQTTKNDALVLVEASMNDAVVFVTTRTELLRADGKEIGLVLVEHHRNNILIAAPKNIIEAFCASKPIIGSS